MPEGLRRIYGGGDFHFITCSCYQRQSFLGIPERRDLWVEIVEEVRKKYDFAIEGYVVMPEHFHMLMSEPKLGSPSLAMQVLKQRIAKRCLESSEQKNSGKYLTSRAFWQHRFYDFNVYSERKWVEKLKYMHWNPVERGLVKYPEQWAWSSYRHHHGLDNPGVVKIGR